jgi:hypothetical protein
VADPDLFDLEIPLYALQQEAAQALTDMALLGEAHI